MQTLPRRIIGNEWKKISPPRGGPQVFDTRDAPPDAFNRLTLTRRGGSRGFAFDVLVQRPTGTKKCLSLVIKASDIPSTLCALTRLHGGSGRLLCQHPRDLALCCCSSRRDLHQTQADDLLSFDRQQSGFDC